MISHAVRIFFEKKFLQGFPTIFGSFWLILAHWELFKITLIYYGPTQTFSDHLGPSWTVLDFLGPIWTIFDHIGPFRNILDHFFKKPFWTNFLTILHTLKPFKTNMDPFGPFQTILKYFVKCWIILDHFSPFWANTVVFWAITLEFW